jgi:CHAD domain-containing protein
MPRSTRAKSTAIENLPSQHSQRTWSHLKQLLRVSLQDTRSMLFAWTQTRQIETLHQARLAWRRQKCLLKFYKPLLPEPPKRFRTSLQALWQLTGQLRNLDVALQSTLPAWRHAHPDVATQEWPGLMQQLHEDRQRACRALTHALHQPQVAAGFQQRKIWLQRLDTDPLNFKRQHFKNWAKQRLHRLHRKMQAQRHPFSPERQHQCRILLKQERHALESLLASQPNKKWQAQLKRVRKKQIVWGRAQDMQMVLNLIEGTGHCPDLTHAWRASMGLLESSR